MAHTDTNTIEATLLLRIEEKREVLFSLPPLPEDTLRTLHEEMNLLHTYYSNAIAGNSLTLAETELIVTEGATIKEKSPAEHREAMNTAKAFERMEALATEGAPMSHATIQRIHAVVMGAMPDDSGTYRRTNVNITGAGKNHPNWTEVLKLMNQLLATVQKSRLHPIETAAYLYHGFVDIHPFTDGNGKVARLFTCLYLRKQHYPAVVMRKETRKRYTHLLRSADTGDISPFSHYIAKAVDESLTLTLAAYGGDDELLAIEGITENTGDAPHSAYSQHSPEYFIHQAERGVLDAVKMGDAWYTSRRALERYGVVREHADEER